MSRKKIDGLSNLNYKGTDHAYQMSERSIQVPRTWLDFFRKMVSTNIRKGLSTSQTQQLNRLAAGINQGKTDPSPRCDSGFTGFSLTPTLRDFLPPTTALDFTPIYFRGVQIMAILPSTSTELSFPDLVAEDTFKNGLPMIDDIRNTFSHSVLRKLDERYPEIVKCFGQKNLFDLLSLQKREIKASVTIFGQMILNDFSESDMLKDFWSLLMKWLIFSRFTESLVALITNMIQFPDGRDLVISNTGLEALKQLLQEITPVPSTTLPGVRISSEDQTTRFVENMRNALQDLMQFAKGLSGHVRSTSKFDGHIKAIEEALKAMEKFTPPKKTSKNMNLFDLKGLSKLLGSSGSKVQVTEMVCEMLGKNPKYSKLARFFQAGRGTFFLGMIFDLRIECLEKQRLEMEARNRLAKATIRNQQLERELMRQKIKTEKQSKKLAAPELAAPGFDIRDSLVSVQAQTAPLANPGPVQAQVNLHGRLDPEQSSKRSRQEQSSGAQPPKRPAFDLRDGLVDLRAGIDSERSSKRSRQ